MVAQATSANTPLDDTDPTLSNYTDALWFQGDFPTLGTDWPSADSYAVITPLSPEGTEFTPLRVQLFQCREMEQPGRACAYPPPPAPLGGAVGPAMGPAMGPGAAPGPWQGPAQGGSNGNGNGTGTSRRLLQFSSDDSEEGCARARIHRDALSPSAAREDAFSGFSKHSSRASASAPLSTRQPSDLTLLAL